MSKKLRSIIAGGIAVVLLITTLVVLKLTDDTEKNTDDSSSESSSSTSFSLYEQKIDDVMSVKIKNEKAEYEVVRLGSEKWTVEEFDGLPFNETQLKSLVTAAASVNGRSVVEEDAQDLAKYGFDKPQAEISVTFKDSDKTVKEFLVGTVAPAASQYYFKFKDDNTVYTVYQSAMNVFLQDKTSVLTMTPLVAPATSSDYPRIDELIIKRDDLDYDIKMVYDTRLDDEDAVTGSTSEQIMVSPIKITLDPNTCMPVTHGLFGLTASEILAVKPTDEDFKNGGISDPACVITMKAEQNNYKLILGKNMIASEDSEDGTVKKGDITGVIGYFEGTDILYKFPVESLPQLYFDPLSITSKMLAINYIYDVDTLSVTAGGLTNNFKISGNSSDDNVVITKDGKSLDLDIFKSFYQFVIKAPAEEIYLGDIPANTEKSASIVYTMRDGTTQTYDFYPTTDRKTIVTIDGKVSVKMKTSYIDVLVKNMKALESGDSIVMIW